MLVQQTMLMLTLALRHDRIQTTTNKKSIKQVCLSTTVGVSEALLSRKLYMAILAMAAFGSCCGLRAAAYHGPEVVLHRPVAFIG